MLKPTQRLSKDTSGTLSRKKNCLYHYFKLLKELPHSQDIAKGKMCAMVSENTKYYYAPETTARYINEMLQDGDAVRDVMRMIDEGVTE